LSILVERTSMNRRSFLRFAGSLLAGGVGLGAALSAGCGSKNSPNFTATSNDPAVRPNILFIVLDEFRYPPTGYGPNEGELAGLKELFGFAPELSADNPFLDFFPGFARLRNNSVVMRNHFLASAACVPSRTAMLTGQYSTVTGVTTTYGLFTEPEEVQLLAPDGVPTVGDWFRAAGYSTHFFGLFDVAEVDEPYDLSPWGFSCWEESGPNPHGGGPSDLGIFRDPGFAEQVSDFLQGRGACAEEANSGSPWFTVASLVNPHDVTAYPFPFYGNVAPPPSPPGQPQAIPSQGALSNDDPTYGVVPLNPDGFPQENFGPPPSLSEDLSTKPSCQFDYTYKMQLAFGAQLPDNVRAQTGYPWKLQGDLADPWVLAYSQFYTWLHYVVDQQLTKILTALDQSGQADNTIVVFCADHGDLAGAHGAMIQKWHSAYQEAIHVPLVVSSPLVNTGNTVREVTQATSHIDLLPTLLGLAGLGGQIPEIGARITGQSPVVLPVGEDLSELIFGTTTDPLPRPGVLFTTDDEITGLPPNISPQNPPAKLAQYEVFLDQVEQVRNQGVALTPGSVRQPNHVRCLCTPEWKFARYFDPNGQEPDQYEMYSLTLDPNETTNLVDFQTLEVRTDVSLPGLTVEQVTAERDRLRSQLAERESVLL
jgi:arylsulfatase A-like enzyme